MYYLFTGNSAGVDACEMVSVETQTDQPQTKPTKFYVGDSGSDDSDTDVDMMSAVTEMQKQDSLTAEYRLKTEPHPPRPLQECVAIFRSSV